MTIQLHHIDHVPRALPIWQTILDDLGNPPAHRIARTLGVSERTVYRWNAAEQAPRCAALALFWLTRWGHSHINAKAVNDAAWACRYLNALETELKTLRHQLDHVSRLADTGAANRPLMRPPL